MQQFWHVFIAYAVAWGLVFGWAVAIFRRMGRVEERLREAGLDVDEYGIPVAASGASPAGARGATGDMSRDATDSPGRTSP